MKSYDMSDITRVYDKLGEEDREAILRFGTTCADVAVEAYETGLTRGTTSAAMQGLKRGVILGGLIFLGIKTYTEWTMRKNKTIDENPNEDNNSEEPSD